MLSVDASRLEKLSFSFSLIGSASNNLQVAVGHDSNQDGDLDLEEADLTFGYDCGVWFSDETESGCRTEESATPEGSQIKVFEISKKRYRSNWDLLKYTRRGVGDVSEVVEQDETHVKFMITIR